MVFKILALGGGGSKGILHIGAIKFLEEKYGNVQKQFSGGFYGCSVGAIIATCLAFGMKAEVMERISCKFSSFSEILFEDMSIEKFSDSLTKKGLFDPKCLEDFFEKLFNEAGINLKGKKISDAPYPLYICSSNITKKIITVFKGDIPILEAISASSCLPLIFYPKVINNCAYVDGGYLTNIVMSFVPENERRDTLSISIVHEDPKLSPSKICKQSTIMYYYSLYMVSCFYERKLNKYSNNIELGHTLASGISDVGEKERNEMIARGYELTRAFYTERSS
jgi:predicted acylesterase/phospholipase RssA